MTLPPTVKQPHYVWRYYLQAWEVRGKLIAYRKGTIFPSKAANVAKEGGFHDLRFITNDDEAFLRSMVVRSGSASESVNNKFINDFVTVRRACDAILNSSSSNKEAKDYARHLLRNFEEQLHSDLEIRGIPWLDSLRRQDATFIQNPDNRLYYLFIATQYFRTKRMMTKMIDAFGAFDHGMHAPRVERIWQLMRHILATNVGGSLHQDRMQYRTIFLQAVEDKTFITGAQPIVNTFGSKVSLIAPDDLELYYPLTPKLAMLHTQNAITEDGATITADDTKVEYYNQMMIDASPDYFFGADKKQIEEYAKRLDQTQRM